MIDQQLQHKDSRVILANHEMKLAQVAAMLEAANVALTELEPALGYIYEKAEQQGDEDNKLAAADSWQRARQIAQHAEQIAGHVEGMGAILKTALDQRDQIADELDTLIDAMEEDDWDDPRLKDFVQSVQSWAEEAYMDEGEEIVWASVHNQIAENLHNYGLTGTQADNALALLQGKTTLDEEQVELLRMLLDSIVQHEEAH